jgi:hypothetical protein
MIGLASCLIKIPPWNCMKDMTGNSTHDAQIFPRSRSHSYILCAINVTWHRFHSEDPHILGATENKFRRLGNMMSGIFTPLTPCILILFTREASVVTLTFLTYVGRSKTQCTRIHYTTNACILTDWLSIFLLCIWIPSSVLCSIALIWIPDDDSTRNRNM